MIHRHNKKYRSLPAETARYFTSGRTGIQHGARDARRGGGTERRFAAYEDGIDEAGFPDDNEPSPTELAARLEAIDTVAAELETADVSYEIRGAIGVEGETIIQETDAADGDLLFLSGRKRSPTGKAVFGSTAHRIMMNASCPVLFVREDIYSAENE